MSRVLLSAARFVTRLEKRHAVFALLREAFHLFVDPAPTQLLTRAEPLSMGLLPVP